MKFFILIASLFVLTVFGVEQNSLSPKIKIALLSSPSIIGKYSQSSYNVALATLLASDDDFELIKYDIPNESYETISITIEKIVNEGNVAILAPLTLQGAQNVLNVPTAITIFIPTVHKRDIGPARDNIIFGAIDYEAQLKALVPYMANSLAIFYGESLVGSILNKTTQSIASESNKKINSFSSYSVDAKGANIVKHLARPAAFSKKSVITHLPIVKTSMLLSHMTFTGVHEKNILSTQINYDPELLLLTQFPDRKNMIIANSIIEQVPSIYETNALMYNDLTFDWINYTTSVGADYLISYLYGHERSYSMPIINNQIIYPVELLRPKESGFEPYNR
ncbi:MAG: hypothetical protein M1300_06575 [Epsilonproteobacteria bacterium]|nr:hypothetical protein [Campylobacterota bacterium]